MTPFWPSDITICIPAFKAAGSLAQFLPRLSQTVPASNILVIDDGSNDNTPQVCASCGIRCTTLERNRGKGRALARGFAILRAEKSRFIVTMDADGQHAIEDLPLFLDALLQNPQSGIIIGNREMKTGKMPVARIFSNRLTSWILSRMTGQKILDSQSGYRAYNCALLDKIAIQYDRFEMESEVIIKAARLGFPIGFVGVQTLYCSDRSNISHVADTLRWIRAVLNVRLEKSL